MSARWRRPKSMTRVSSLETERPKSKSEKSEEKSKISGIKERPG